MEESISGVPMYLTSKEVFDVLHLMLLVSSTVWNILNDDVNLYFTVNISLIYTIYALSMYIYIQVVNTCKLGYDIHCHTAVFVQ